MRQLLLTDSKLIYSLVQLHPLRGAGPERSGTELPDETGQGRIQLGQLFGASDAFAPWRKSEVVPGPSARTRDDLRAYVRQTAGTYHHQVGTCKMGAESDVDAVVGADLRVRGVEGLRVADASIMPAVPSGNTNAPSIMVGERASDLILGR
ncbi:GMC oxidoreductase [Rhodococcus sp. 1R11]|uniref:GMC oxidoreductase n=1 Tax=Rhodococcus sp. 1R11 TaxID=2559614 RepID=UPI002468EEAD|nr:GMC oxidoreductase [Rhodococcus sp. 1R11]